MEVTLQNFEEVVVRGSMQRPVVVDFWASWCAPCKALGPVLEKLSVEMNFVLAKVNTETNQKLAEYFRISSIPDVRVFNQGKMVDSFQGALPESQIRQILARHCLSEIDALLLEVEAQVTAGNGAAAIGILEDTLAAHPTDKKIRYWLARCHLSAGNSDQTLSLLNEFREGDDFYRQARSLVDLMAFYSECARKDNPTEPMAKSYKDNCCLAANGDHKAALEGFLAMVSQDKAWNDEAARKAMITLFDVLGAKHEWTWEYRSRLNRILFV